MELAGGGLGQPCLTEAERGAPEPGHRFQIFAAGLVADVDALAAGDDQRPLALVTTEVGEGMKLVRDVPGPARGGVHGRAG